MNVARLHAPAGNDEILFQNLAGIIPQETEEDSLFSRDLPEDSPISSEDADLHRNCHEEIDKITKQMENLEQKNNQLQAIAEKILQENQRLQELLLKSLETEKKNNDNTKKKIENLTTQAETLTEQINALIKVNEKLAKRTGALVGGLMTVVATVSWEFVGPVWIPTWFAAPTTGFLSGGGTYLGVKSYKMGDVKKVTDLRKELEDQKKELEQQQKELEVKNKQDLIRV